ncbi:MAG: YggS family pyridoxal phosphate-dependent enzyme [Elusimicrobia bacterium]|nr:YggS family pyridoxal phosphate-dependent enzyme [Elusimicrobiota bacterium]
MAILENLHGVLRRIEAAADRAGRDPAEIELVAVTKKARPEAILELLGSGRVRHVGENRVQDAAAKRKALEARGAGVIWRMLGHLQRNKSRQALEVFGAVDSLDSLELAAKLDGELAETGRTLPVLVQVKLAERETQSGLAPESVGEFLDKARAMPRLELRGLMAIAPMLDPVEAVRPHFRRMKRIFERCFPGGGTLSMGMSRDFEIAVEEGANMVRVGSALFN